MDQSSLTAVNPLFVPSHLFLITWGLSSHWLNACSIQWEGFSFFLIQTLEALFVVVVWVYSTQSATATATYDLSQSSNSVDIVTFAINNLRGLKWLWFWIAFRSSQVDCSSSVSPVRPNQGSEMGKWRLPPLVFPFFISGAKVLHMSVTNSAAPGNSGYHHVPELITTLQNLIS